MTRISEDARTVFVGQSVAFGGQRAHETFLYVPKDQRLEMPIAEDFQVGFCTGLSLAGRIPVCFVPRWDFLLIAANQIINHLDKLSWMGWAPKVIIRTAVGGTAPLDPGPQHTQDYSLPFRLMTTTINIVSLHSAEGVALEYRKAMESEQSTILVERMDLY